MAWNLYTLKVQLEASRMENARLSAKLGKTSSSIWTMNKSELVETARKELSMSLAQAEKESVTTLREKLRSWRSLLKVEEDTLAAVPKGLEKMTLADLRTEALTRDLPEPEPCTRAKLIVLIRDDVNNRRILSSSTMDPAANMSGPQASGQEDEDWEMFGIENRTRTRRSRR